ncbi:MAG: hypothetical protein JJT75_02305 [Opitutales bacterium]|nr:hypothetical protein [Opitutales bacterium]MCH8541130.1 hypothetical protein [Opitutales bacterium]
MNITSLILRVLAVAGAIAAVVLFMQIKDFHEEIEGEIATTRGQIQESEENLRVMTDDRDTERARADGLQSSLEDARAEIDVLERNLAQTERDLQEARGDLRDARREVSQLEDERDELNQRNAELDRRIARMEDEQERTLAGLRQQVRALEEDLEEAEAARDEQEVAGMDWDDMDADTEESDEPDPVTTEGPIRGLVSAVGSESSFVILDKGSQAGVRENIQYAVFRGDRAIARVQVSEIRDNLAIAQVLPGTLSRSIQQGDAFRSLD